MVLAPLGKWTAACVLGLVASGYIAAGDSTFCVVLFAGSGNHSDSVL